MYALSILLILPLTQLFNMSLFSPTFFHDISVLILNVSMLQSWIPNMSIVYSYNYVGWFICNYMFLMLITIPTLKFLKKKIHNLKSIIICMIMVFLLLVLYEQLIEFNHMNSLYWLFTFPPARVFEYVFSILLGVLIKEISNKKIIKNISTLLYTAFEIGSILILVLTIYLIDSHPYWSMTIGWIFPISLIIFSFSFNKGYISKLISNSFFVFLGSLTFEAYLLHEVVDRYFYIIPNINNALTYERILLYFTYILVVTFLLSYIFHFYFNNKKAKKTR